MEKETNLRNQRLCIFLCAGIVVLLIVGTVLIATISGGYMDQGTRYNCRGGHIHYHFILLHRDLCDSKEDWQTRKLFRL